MLLIMDKSTESPALKNYSSAYGSCKYYKEGNGTRMVPISYPHLYQYRGVELKNLDRIEYFSTIQIQKDQPDTNDEESPTHNVNLDKKSKTKKFDKGIEIWANDHQTLHSKQCPPKFSKNPPTHPGQSPMTMKQILMYLHNGTRRQRNLLNII